MLDFSCDYNVGTAPEILRALTDINNDHEKTYGWDKYCDITMKDLGTYCDAFYIGGTKCGALMGEALVFKAPQSRFFTHRKRHGGLLAKGWLLGIQFDTLFTDELYYKLGKNAFDRAMQIKAGLKELGYEFYSDSKTNQQFILVSDEKLEQISKDVTTDYWGKKGDKNIIRICTSWKTTEEEVSELLKYMK